MSLREKGDRLKNQVTLSTEPEERERGREGDGDPKVQITGQLDSQELAHILSREYDGRTQLWSVTPSNIQGPASQELFPVACSLSHDPGLLEGRILTQTEVEDNEYMQSWSLLPMWGL